MSGLGILILDFNNIPGNSGGPVFYYNATGARRQAGNLVLDPQPEIRILGLVSGFAPEHGPQPAIINGVQVTLEQLRSTGLGVIPNAAAIQETIDKLPR